MTEPRVENALLAVAAGAGPAILPESVMERYATPGIRFVRLDGAVPALQTAVLTHPDNESLATAAFLRAVGRAANPGFAPSTPRLAGVAA
jgi:DNA-binding transcriptional LysR family regulator